MPRGGTTPDRYLYHVTESIIMKVSFFLFSPLVDFQGRALSRAKSRRNLDFQDVLDRLADLGIAIRVASPKLVMEEVSLFFFLAKTEICS